MKTAWMILPGLLALGACGGSVSALNASAQGGGAGAAAAGSGGAPAAGGSGGAPVVGGSGGTAPSGPVVTACSSSVPAACAAPPSFPQAEIDATKAAEFIFRGTVSALNATTEPGVPANGLFIVDMDQQFSKSEFMSQFKQVTVEPPGGITVSLGGTYDFFANNAIDGQGVVVSEVDHVAAGAYPNIASDVPAIKQILTDRKNYDNLASAVMIVRGSVTSVGQPREVCGTEHDPVWTDAQVDVDCTLYSSSPAPKNSSPLTVLFAASQDIMWANAPKLTPGQRSIFVLHPESSGMMCSPSSVPGQYAGVVVGGDPTPDVWAVSDEPALVRLLTCPPPAL